MTIDKQPMIFTSPTSFWSHRAVRYGLALAIIIAALVVRLALVPVMGLNVPYVTIYPAIMIVAVMLGAGPGMFAALVGILLAERHLMQPGVAIDWNLSLAIRAAIVLGASLYLGRVGQTLRAARAKAETEAAAARTAEAALRKLSERDSFRVALAAALHPLTDVREIKSTAARVLGQHLRASRVAYAEVTAEGNVIIEPGYTDGVADIPGRYRLDDYGPGLLREIRAGHNIVVTDVASDPGFSDQEKARYRAVQVAGNLNVPLIKNGRPVALLAVHQAMPRRWTAEDVSLVEATTEWTWATVERARVEEALRASETRLRRFYESGLFGVIYWNMNGEITDANDKFLEMVGYDRADLTSGRLDWAHMTPPEYRPLDERSTAELKAGGVNKQPFEKEYLRKDGTRLPVLVAGAMLDEVRFNGMAFVLDITERKKAEEAVLNATLHKRAAEYSRTLIEVSLDPLVTISPDGKITDVNDATIKATGMPRDALIGTDFSTYFTEPEKARDGYRQVFSRGFVTDYPLTIRHRHGQLTDVLYNASVYKDAQGTVLGVFAAARDVTAQKQAEAELKRHRDRLEVLVKERTAELEASNKDLAKSNENLEQFAYVASHDLQEPLRIMASYSQLLEKRYKNQLDQSADEFIDYIVDAAGRMQKLISDLLAYSRAGHRGIAVEDVDCTVIVRRTVASLGATLQAAGGTVTYDALPVVRAHEAGMIQVFQNLIGNALKFRGEEPPRVHVGATKGDHEWVFSVRDNGIGIEPQYFDRIFVIFQRLHTREKYTGTGIGLSICKKIVENLGGRIWVESGAGQGTTFHFTIPVAGKE